MIFIIWVVLENNFKKPKTITMIERVEYTTV